MVHARPQRPDDALLDDTLAAPFTRLDEAGALSLLSEGWGIEPVGVRRLDTERDDSFVVDGGSSRYVLKVAHPLDDPAFLDLQCAALVHVADRDPGLPVSLVLPDVEGGALRLVRQAEGEPRLARLLGYLPGDVLAYDGTTAEQRRAVGAALARLSLALADFEHPAAHRSLPWDLQQSGSLRPLLDYVSDPAARADCLGVLDRYDAYVGVAVAATRQQVLHNDLNPDNVLVAGEAPAFVTGILDFGDMVHTSVVADLAVCMSYPAGTASAPGEEVADPWAAPYDVAAGYLAVRPLQRDELRLLPDLVRTRLAQRQLVNSWLASVDPANAHYTGRSLASSAHALRLLVSTLAPIERGEQ